MSVMVKSNNTKKIKEKMTVPRPPHPGIAEGGTERGEKVKSRRLPRLK